MTGHLAHITRHPIKAHGRESLKSVQLSVGECLPFDRRWAVVQDGASVVQGWNSCVLFSRGAKSPQLMAVTAELDEAAERVTLNHPVQGQISIRPDEPADLPGFLAWASPLVAPGRIPPARLVRHDGGMTDSDYPTVSILSLSTLADLSARMGTDLSIHRWRANLWIDGAEPWAEFGWIGQKLTIGGAVLEVVERIGRCNATKVNPETGEIDADTTGTLEKDFGHTDFGVFAKVVQSGPVAVGDIWSLT
ncbi:MAG: MOSC domain-containing protein [Candidatus Saccharibacteria bacterium]|nr:MOSC domain-containing protein [Pseudorhodobacter sp.]